MRNVLGIGLLAVALAGCASVGGAMARSVGNLVPGYGVTPEVAQRLGCNYDSLQARAAYYRQLYFRRPEGSTAAMIPVVGMDHCEVLAMLGLPDDQRQTQTVSGTTLTWYYKTGNTMGVNTESYHLVELSAGAGGRLAVSTVVW